MSLVDELRNTAGGHRRLRWQAADELERLQAGGCRFNCRSQREAFVAGYKAGRDHECLMSNTTAEDEYKAWKREQRDS